MAFSKPSTVVPTPDERELLLRFLNRQREEVVAVAEGLSDEQARWTPDGALLSVVGVINHLTHVEWRWVEGRYLGQPFPERTDEFAADGIGVEQACAAYWAQAQRTDEIVRAAPSLEVLASDERGTGLRRIRCSGSTNRWICAGCYFTSSRKPRTTLDTPTPLGSFSTARSCDLDPIHNRYAAQPR